MEDRTARDTQWERQCQLRGRPWKACGDPEDMEGIMPALGRLSTLFPGVAIRAGGVDAGGSRVCPWNPGFRVFLFVHKRPFG